MAKATYTEGSVMGHMLSLATTSAIGMVAIFAVDLADLFFISLLGIPALAAAVGFAGILFFTTASVGMALSVASSSLVSRALGRDEETEASQLFLDVALFGAVLGTAISLTLYWFAPNLLSLLGAKGEVHTLAVQYFRTVNWSLPLLIVGMTSGAALRASGMAKFSLVATLSGGVVNAVLDPLFIFGFDWGLQGAAYATICSRVVVLGLSLYGSMVVAGLLKGARISKVNASLGAVFAIAIPSLITSLSTPIASAFVTNRLAPYGDDVIAGVSVFGRILPLAFVGLFTLTMSLSPIIGQNFGAGKNDRIKSALRNAAIFSFGYTLPVALLLAVLAGPLASVFGLPDEGREIFLFYCRVLAFSYGFFGLHLAASQCFTNIGHPTYSTIANLIRDLAFMLPLVALGGASLGAKGVLLGQYGATVLSGTIVFAIAWALVSRLERGDKKAPAVSDEENTKQGLLFHRPVTAHGVIRGH